MITLRVDSNDTERLLELSSVLRILEFKDDQPHKFVCFDEYGKGMSLDEAMNTMEELVSGVDWLEFYDDNKAREFMEALKKKNDNLQGEFPYWYVGVGWYNERHGLEYEHGDMGFRDDILLYKIEEFIPLTLKSIPKKWVEDARK